MVSVLSSHPLSQNFCSRLLRCF